MGQGWGSIHCQTLVMLSHYAQDYSFSVGNVCCIGTRLRGFVFQDEREFSGWCTAQRRLRWRPDGRRFDLPGGE